MAHTARDNTSARGARARRLLDRDRHRWDDRKGVARRNHKHTQNGNGRQGHDTQEEPMAHTDETNNDPADIGDATFVINIDVTREVLEAIARKQAGEPMTAEDVADHINIGHIVDRLGITAADIASEIDPVELANAIEATRLGITAQDVADTIGGPGGLARALAGEVSVPELAKEIMTIGGRVLAERVAEEIQTQPGLIEPVAEKLMADDGKRLAKCVTDFLVHTETVERTIEESVTRTVNAILRKRFSALEDFTKLTAERAAKNAARAAVAEALRGMSGLLFSEPAVSSCDTRDAFDLAAIDEADDTTGQES